MKKLILIALTVLSTSAFAKTVEFKMDKKPHAIINDNCDKYTLMKLTIDGSSATAELTNRVDGLCEVMVMPNPRTYHLTWKTTQCGSKFYVDAAPNGKAIAELTDHRSRQCRDMPPAYVMFTEFDGDTAYDLYSRN
jgi:hypothetical protein